MAVLFGMCVTDLDWPRNASVGNRTSSKGFGASKENSLLGRSMAGANLAPDGSVQARRDRGEILAFVPKYCRRDYKFTRTSTGGRGTGCVRFRRNPSVLSATYNDSCSRPT